MSYELKYTKTLLKHLNLISKSGNKALHKKLVTLLFELKEHPTSGTGQVEQLKHYEIPTYSRRLNKQHRLVYEVYEEEEIVSIISAWGHYD